MKAGQTGTGQKTQQIQLQQLQQPGSVAGSIQQQILLRSSPSHTKAGQTHIQGLLFFWFLLLFFAILLVPFL